ncbi:hypothetical protein [Pseudomonas nabeulensis]|uniref:hypothetical protein n=1 Tax=Pseudomonas nabeulensis TaxID=2293833 RepID=UPI001076864E|nr:hypothetical protein [Pseudomonas nabeulensis]
MAKTLNGHEGDISVSPIAAHSTFGEWWAQLRHAFQAPDITQWMNDRGIDPDSVEINPGSGKIIFRLKHALDPRRIQRTVGQDDVQWAAASRHLMAAGRIIAAGSFFSTFKPAQAKNRDIAPLKLISHFYRVHNGVNNSGRQLTTQELTAAFAAGKGFETINDPVFTYLREQRNEEALLNQKAMLGDVHSLHAVVETLNTLINGLKSGTADIPTYLADYHVSVHRDSHSEYAGTTPSLKQLFDSNGWDIPADQAELENLVRALATPRPASLEHGNYGGALAWSIPVENTTQIQLMADLRNGAFDGIDTRAFSNVLEYLLHNQFIEPSALKNPRELFNTLINTPKGQALGKAIQARFDAKAIKGSVNDWLLAAMSVDPQHTQPGQKRQVAGFLLTDARNGGQTAADIVSSLTNHLLDTRRSSSFEKAQLQAYLQLSSQAPEFLVQAIPDAVRFGTHSWVSFATAVERVEADAPGATARMTYAQVMLAADIAPITAEQREVEYRAQQVALKDWAVVNGMGYPLTEAAILEVRNAFDKTIQELRSASAAQSMEMPNVEAKGLQELKNAFPDMDPALFKKKCIQLKRQHLDFPGPYSILDLYMHDGARGTPGFYDGITRDTADSANQWISTSADVDFNKIHATLVDLPNLKEYFRVAFPLYTDAYNKSIATQVKQLISTQSLEHRKNFEFGKVTLAKQVINQYSPYSRVKTSSIVSEGQSLLVKTELEGKINIYEIDIKQNKILHRDDLNDFYKSDLKEPSIEYREIVPSGTYSTGISGEREDASGVPKSFNSERTAYIADAMVKEANIDGYKLAAKGQTTFDTEAPFYKAAVEFMLNLIPLRSAIKNFSEDHYGEGIVDMTMDAFGFLMGLHVAAKGAKALQVGASIANKVAFGGKIVGRAAISSLNPLDGVGQLLTTVAKAGAKGSVNTYRWLCGSLDSYDLVKASKRFDASASGTFKLQGTLVEGPAVLTQGKWHAFDAASGQAYGKALDDFVPSLRSSQPRLGEWATATPNHLPESNALRKQWTELVEQHKTATDSAEFQRGYSEGDPMNVHGYRKTMKSEEVMKLATSGQFTPAEIGSLVRQTERLAVQHGFKGVSQVYEHISAVGGNFVPVPQVFYLSQTNPLSKGQCAAMSRLMASAMEQGTEKTFIANMFTAAANPTAPGSREFITQLAGVQKQLGSPTLFHAAKPRPQMSYKAMMDELTNASGPKTLMISTPEHAMVAGTVGEGLNKKFFFYDPNFGLATFSSPGALKRGLEKVFTDKKLSVQYVTHSKDPNKLEFEVSEYDNAWKKTTEVSDKTVKNLTEVPLVIEPARITPPSLPRSKQVSVIKPAKVEVLMGQSQTLTDKTSHLSTNSLSDCSAVIVLSDLKDGVYQKRTLVHLTGSNLEQPVNNGRNGFAWVREMEENLANGGKIIFVGGTETRSVVGVATAIGQQDSLGKKPLLELLQRKDVSVTYASSGGVDVSPNGSFTLRDDAGAGVFDEKKVRDILDFAKD